MSAYQDEILIAASQLERRDYSETYFVALA